MKPTLPDKKLLEDRLRALIERMACSSHFRPPGADRRSDETLELMNRSGLTMTQFMALRMLSSRGACSVGAVAEKIGLSRPATSQLVDRLYSMGMVSRIEDPVDRRQKQLSASAKAEALLQRITEAQARHLSAFISILEVETLQKLVVAFEATVRDFARYFDSEKQS